MPAIPLTDNFIPAFNFQEVLVDKDTATPLSQGIVTFYQDAQRTVLKDIFQLTGTPGSYTITQLPNPITLSAVGTFQDNSGNDIVPYFYPYDVLGQPEFYYVTIYSSLDGITPDTLQFTREHVPYIQSQGNNNLTLNIKNYIPDGQFLIHNNVVNVNNDPAYISGQIYNPVTYIAPNGWTFERNSGSAALDTVNFVKIPITNIPVGNPTYACHVTCILSSVADTYKYLAINFGDVNKFANDNTYTFAFSAKAISSPGAVTIKCRKNYGTGGSTEEIIDLGVVGITTSETMYNISFSLGSNIGKNLGTDNTDFCSFIISFFPNQAFDFQFTDFILANGAITFNSFPVTTNSEFLYTDIAGSSAIPDYNALDLYLPQILTPYGLIFDHRAISRVVLKSTPHLEIGELWANGHTYTYSDFSSDGIPYSRLADKFWMQITSGPNIYWEYRYGSGDSFVSIHITSSNVGEFIENNIGTVTHLANGSISTGFIFTTIQDGDSGHQYIASIDFLSGSSFAAGAYFTFYDTLGNHYYVWYRISGVGSDPAVAGAIGIVIDILLTDTDATVNFNTMYAINHKYFALPDYRGYFPRFWDDAAGIDPDASSRLSAYSGKSVIGGDTIGSYQLDEIANHLHGMPSGALGSHSTGYSYLNNSGVDQAGAEDTGSFGGNETRAINMYVGAAILY